MLGTGCDVAFHLDRPDTSICVRADLADAVFCEDFDDGDPLAQFSLLDGAGYATLVDDAWSAPRAVEIVDVGGPSADARLTRAFSATAPFEIGARVNVVEMNAEITSAKLLTLDLGDRILYLYTDGLVRERVQEATPPVTTIIGQATAFPIGEWTPLTMRVDLAASRVEIAIGDEPALPIAFTPTTLAAILFSVGPHDPLPGTENVAITTRFDDLYLRSAE